MSDTRASIYNRPDYGFEDTETILGVDAPFVNLFEVELIPETDSPDLDDFPVKNIRSIKIPSMGFNLQRGKLTRKFHVEDGSVVFFKDVVIGFLEDNNYSVLKFHEKWGGHYYNKVEGKNVWISGIANKFVHLRVKLLITSENALARTNERDTPVIIIDIKGVGIPRSLPGLDLDYGKADPISYELSYTAEIIEGDAP